MDVGVAVALALWDAWGRRLVVQEHYDADEAWRLIKMCTSSMLVKGFFAVDG